MPDSKVRRGKGRYVCLDTRLGRMIHDRNIKAYLVAARSGVYARLLTEYTNGRRVITPEHAEALASVLNCKPEDIIEPNLKHDLTDTCGKPFDKSLSSAKLVDTSHLERVLSKKKQGPLPAHVPNVAPERLIRKAV